MAVAMRKRSHRRGGRAEEHHEQVELTRHVDAEDYAAVGIVVDGMEIPKAGRRMDRPGIEECRNRSRHGARPVADQPNEQRRPLSRRAVRLRRRLGQRRLRGARRARLCLHPRLIVEAAEGHFDGSSSVRRACRAE